MKKLFIILIMLTCCAAAVSAASKPSSKTMLEFTHKYQSEYDCSMKLNNLRTLAKLMPAKMKKEIADEYYPSLREGLSTNGSMKFKKADATLQQIDDEMFDIVLDFPKFTLAIKNATWDELDRFFIKNFK